MYRTDSAGIWLRSPCAIDFVLKPARSRAISFNIGPWIVWRRHRLSAQFDDDTLPGFRIRVGIRSVESVQHEAGGFEPLVVTSDAVFIDYGLRSLAVCGGRALLRSSILSARQNKSCA